MLEAERIPQAFASSTPAITAAAQLAGLPRGELKVPLRPGPVSLSPVDIIEPGYDGRGGDGMRRFNPSSSHAARAVQCWQILVGKAKNRQTVTYKGLSELMYQKPAAGVLNEILGHVAFYCIDHELPPLTSIVVNTRGVPGARHSC